jgi:hypothetical protein
MVPKLHAKGASFKGAAAYLLHDKGRAQSAERVAWAETRNLATDKPEVAWRVMAATAMDQDRLKEQAGVKATGRKSAQSVLHFSLSWHPDEKEKLSREEMRRAALGALRSLGADDRQALLICHDDEEQPHLHVLVNRISAEDGRMLSSSKEKLNLSRWAQTYENERGRIYCDQRVINNAARDRDEYTRGKKDKARNVYEAEPANDNTARAKAIRDEQRRRAAEIAKRARQVRRRHQQEWADLAERHRLRQTNIKQQAKRQALAAIDTVRRNYRKPWEMLFHEDQAERRQVELREKTLIGRVQNALRAIDYAAIIQGKDRRKAISEAFEVFSGQGPRLEALKQSQERRARQLLTQQRYAERTARAQAHSEKGKALQEARARFGRERADLLLSQSLESAKLRADWKTRASQHKAAWDEHRSQGVDKTRAAELADRARAIAAHKERMHERDRSTGRRRDRERDD